jgi:uncharacterized membrane protein
VDIGNVCAYTSTMSLKNAALFALIGMMLLTVFLAVDFIDTILNVARGLVPAMKLPTAFVALLASVGLTVFFYVFRKDSAECALSAYPAADDAIYFLGGLIMMWAPAVPGYISHGALSLGLVDSPVDSGVAKGK